MTQPFGSRGGFGANTLAALKRAVEVMDAEGIVFGDCDDEPLDVLGVSRNAIAKAEGR